MAQEPRRVFVTGGTGYIGGKLIPTLLSRGHQVRALTRAGSERKVAPGAIAVTGDALDAASVAAAVQRGETIVHLVGTPHPNPSKAAEFLRVDLASALATVHAAQQVAVPHLVFLSVAQPAPMMHDYVNARAQAERAIAEAKLTASVLRPWYVLGPGHRWPMVLVPLYAIASKVPSLRDGAERMGLVTLAQMVKALVLAVETPPAPGTIRVVDVPAIRAA